MWIKLNYLDFLAPYRLLCSKDGLYQGMHTNTMPNTILDNTNTQYQQYTKYQSTI